MAVGTASVWVGAVPHDREIPVQANTPATGNIMTDQCCTDLGPLQTTDLEHGTIVLNYIDGSLTYTPDTDFVGTDSFDYCPSAEGTTCLSDDRATVTFTVTGPQVVPTTTTLTGPPARSTARPSR